MIEQRIKAATCRIACGNESGTGWLIANGCVITARHCVLAAITEGKPIELFFPDSDDVAVPSSIIAESEENDACLLSLDAETSAKPIPVTFEQPRDGEAWQAFGYPQTKPALGHRLSGVVAQVLVTPKLKVDLDLSVDPIVALQAYRGLSGAAVVCEGFAVGIIRLKVDGTVAALSFHQFKSFLSDHGVTASGGGETPRAEMLADRKAFSKTFAQAIQARTGSYLFLEGAHGYGKSTFCRNFEPHGEKLVNLGAYCLSSPDSALGPDYRAQPQVFLDWLSTTISVLVTGQPSRKSENTYPEQIREAAEYLQAFSEFCSKTERQGIFFVDGLNEVPAGPLLGLLIGLLPIKLPPGLTVVLTAPNVSTVAAHLGSRIKDDNVFVLPPLPESACYSYCHRALKPERASPALVNRICEKAQGHPLYLRYLIEYANRQSGDDALDEFPTIEGSIEDYYNNIWSRLLADEGAVNVLALMARLRWGIPLSDFAKMLSQTEQASFVSVITRIRHLLESEDYTGLYHASFATFIEERTSEIDEMAYRRIAGFCQQETELRYCVLNRIFHLLRAADSSVFASCNQQWFDEAVTLGVEPDALIADVSEVVNRAATEASADEFFRVTLLAQRVSFRYNTLFAQAARSIAEALIALARPQDALQHVLRLKTVIVGPDDALQIAFLLHHHGYDDEALMLLDRIQQRIIESYGDMDIRDFLGLCSWHIQTIFLIRLASDGSGMQQVMKVWEMARRSCAEVFKDDTSEADRYMRSIDAESATYFLSFRDEYAEFARVRSQVATIPPQFLHILCTALLKFERAIDDYHLPKARKALAKLWPDLAELIPTAKLDLPFAAAITDTLVRFGAPVELVKAFGAKGGKQPARPLKLVARNQVDVNHEDLQECLCLWRVAAFLDPDFDCPQPGLFLNTGWLDAMIRLIGALYCCDGKARRAKADGDETARVACWDQLKSRVIDALGFTLQQRVEWRDGYAIPEGVLPAVYSQLAELMTDCFPESLTEWLSVLIANADGQWGMYSEGFRASALQVLNQLTRDKPVDEIAAQLLQLLRGLRDHVLRGVENRHELVTELLRIIPLFARLGAHEEAEGLYKYLLSVSMGPTWYKEDQLGLMTAVLGNISSSGEVKRRLPEVAGYLERADGEMTFQRYVRSEKANLLGQIARQGDFRAAVAYFRRECCGSLTELWAEAQQGPIDRSIAGESISR
jgi:Trypsin-like peptidase domain